MAEGTPDALAREEFDALARRAGLALDDAQSEELRAVFGRIAAMAERVRAATVADEPAHVFRADDDA